MTIKAFAFGAQRRVGARLGRPFQRSHVYESIAAAFGFGSYASLAARAVFDTGSPGSPSSTQATDRVALRLAQLGLSESIASEAAIELLAIVSEQGLRAVSLDRLIDSLGSDGSLPSGEYEDDRDSDETDSDSDAAKPCAADEPFEDWGISKFLHSGLEDSAQRGNPSSHYALALLYRVEDAPVGSSYWHDRQEQGEQLSGVQLEWANGHRVAKERELARTSHLREAARLGHPDACVDAAEEFEDPAFLQLIGDSPVRNPARASEVAAELGLVDRARRWCSIAADAGDVEAIRMMVEHFDRGDLPRCWTWVHFARLLGKGLTEDEYRLVNEDGSDYDDDVGGPGFPLGSDGVELPVLNEIQDASARREAEAMAHRLADRHKR